MSDSLSEKIDALKKELQNQDVATCIEALNELKKDLSLNTGQLITVTIRVAHTDYVNTFTIDECVPVEIHSPKFKDASKITISVAEKSAPGEKYKSWVEEL